MNEQLERIKQLTADASREPGIQWNKVTWYSWSLAVFVFLVFIPGVAFYVGTQYQLTQDEYQTLVTVHGVTVSPSGELVVPDTVVKKQPKPIRPAAPVACTAEARLCSDGSSVGRSGPSCEFAKCPSSTGRPTLKGIATVSPVCPVERMPPDPACAPKAYEGSLEVWDVTGGFVKSFAVGGKGAFETELTPGSYVLRLPKTGSPYPSMKPMPFSAEPGKVTELTVSLDSGIR